MLNKSYIPGEIEQKIYDMWLDNEDFKSQKSDDPYTIIMPPPNVTGVLHVGHAFNFTLQDLMIRFSRMQGKDVLWQAGVDHAGIATQILVERQLANEGKSKHDLGRAEFIKRVYEWRQKSGGAIMDQSKRLGVSCDWDASRFTMDEGFLKAVTDVFVSLYEEGLIYQDDRLVNWDPVLETAISDLEVKQEEEKGFLWHIRYSVVDSDESLVIATTRPETLFGDMAVAVHPDDERYRHLVGKMCEIPLCGRHIPIVADDYVAMDWGTGAVKITPAHDFNDFEVGKRHNLACFNILTSKAILNENVPEGYQGLSVEEGRKKVVEALEEKEVLVETEEHLHMIPKGDRSGAVVQPFLTRQWFLNAEVLAKPALEAVRNGDTRFFPKQWERTYFDWLENIQPWCISRQLWWGHQIPAWYGDDGAVFVAKTEEEAYAKAKAHYGGGDVTLRRDEDVLDTWFSSALWPFVTLGWQEREEELEARYPTSLLITGFDIIFFWVARMMMMGLKFMGKVPFRDVYIHPLIRDEKGAKMSKSKGNVIDPLDLINEFGADALRFTLAFSATPGRDIRLSSTKVQSFRNFGTKLWNAVRFTQMNDAMYDPSYDPQKETLHVINRWIVSEFVKLHDKVTKSIEQYRFDEAASALYRFVWDDVCDWYIEFAKCYFMEDAKEAGEFRSCLMWIIMEVLKTLHPFMPYITEEIYQDIFPSNKRLVNASWSDVSKISYDEKAVEEVDCLRNIIREIRSLRAILGISVSEGLLLVYTHQDQKDFMGAHSHIIKRLAKVREMQYHDDLPQECVAFVLNDRVFGLDVKSLIDPKEELARLKKKRETLIKEHKMIEGKLANKGFVSHAPEEVVAEHKERFAVLTSEIAKFDDICVRTEAMIEDA